MPAGELGWHLLKNSAFIRYENGSDRGAISILPGDPWVMRVFALFIIPGLASPGAARETQLSSPALTLMMAFSL